MQCVQVFFLRIPGDFFVMESVEGFLKKYPEGFRKLTMKQYGSCSKGAPAVISGGIAKGIPRGIYKSVYESILSCRKF